MSSVLLEINDRVAWMRLNRPEALNALDQTTVDQLDAHLEALEKNLDVRVVVITGTGRAFCAGADLKGLSDLATGDGAAGLAAFVRRAGEVIERLAALPKPTIAALNGLALAGGLELAMACDLIIASDAARIGDAHANYGLLPGAGGTVRLPRLVGAKLAKALMFSGATVPAGDLVGHGLVNEVVPADDLEARSRELAATLAQKSPAVLATMKRLVDGGLDKPTAVALSDERAAFEKHTHSPELAEGLAAFLERSARPRAN